MVATLSRQTQEHWLSKVLDCELKLLIQASDHRWHILVVPHSGQSARYGWHIVDHRGSGFGAYRDSCGDAIRS